MRSRTPQRGFTIVEIAIAIVALVVVSVGLYMKFSSTTRKARTTEAKLLLRTIGRNVRRVFADRSVFPGGTEPLTPAKPCCEYPDHKCPVDRAAWQHGVWSELDFNVPEPHVFRYSYTGTALEFTATAVGDPDCDGSTKTFTLHGTAPAGNVQLTLQGDDE